MCTQRAEPRPNFSRRLGPMLDSDLQHDVIVALGTYLDEGRF